jgi:hypothetical protein
MASIFASTRSLNSSFIEVSVADINAANSVATAKMIYRFEKFLRFNFIANHLDAEVGLLLAHPSVDSDADTSYRLLWIKVPGSQVMNYSMNGAPYYEFDPGSKLYVYRTSGVAATTGKLMISMW